MIHLDVSRATLIGAARKNVNWSNRDNASKWNDSVCLSDFPGASVRRRNVANSSDQCIDDDKKG